MTLKKKLFDLTLIRLSEIILNLLQHMSPQQCILTIDSLRRITPYLEHKKLLRYLKIAFNRNLHPKCRKMLINMLKSNVTPFLYYTNTIIKKKEYLGSNKNLQKTDFIIISPTARCNLHCKGCFTRNYSKREELDCSLLDRVINEAKDLGVNGFVFLGGESFLRDDLYKLFKTHKNAHFSVTTNGTLINEDIAERIAELGNVSIGISIDGFEKENDERRGEGTFKKIIKSMNYLRKAGVFFGAEIVATRNNIETIISDKFIDFLIKKGCAYAWYYIYIPQGIDNDWQLMPTYKQLDYLIKRIENTREIKNILLGNFRLDVHLYLPSKCEQSARTTIHITPTGDVEPCHLVHFATDNIKQKSLKEILNSNFFRMIREGFTYKEYGLPPCQVRCNQKILDDFINKTKSYPTHPEADKAVEELQIVLSNYRIEYHKEMPPFDRRYLRACSKIVNSKNWFLKDILCEAKGKGIYRNFVKKGGEKI